MTPEQTKTIAAALQTAPFADAGYRNAAQNARAALSELTHYCSESTLRYHHARILRARPVSNGAFFLILETCSQDYANTQRGYRVVLFDLTGSPVYRPDLEQLTRTKERAEKNFWAWFDDFNELMHYRDRLTSAADEMTKQIDDLRLTAKNLAAQWETMREGLPC